MADHKKQHIIPQHYLKGFSKERDDPKRTGDKIIYFHNVKTEKRHSSAIKNIGYDNYFYGKDEFYKVIDVNDEDNSACNNLEDVLNRYETQHNKLLTHIIDYKNLSLTLEEIYSLYTFLMLLKTRTKSAREDVVISAKSFYEDICQRILGRNDRLDRKIVTELDQLGTHVEMMQDVMGSIGGHLELLTDLSPFLLINDTETNFITSDNPVVFYNYMVSKNKSTTAPACSGFMMFCPITEKLSILLCDGYLYHVHGNSQTTIRVKEKSDIDSMNTLQVLRCYEEIYCYDESEIDYIKKVRLKVEKHMAEPKIINTKHKNYKHPDAIDDEIYARQFIETYYKIRLSFLTFNEERLRIYKRIDEYHNKNNIPHAVFRYELRRA